jgi:hypothetical protein
LIFIPSNFIIDPGGMGGMARKQEEPGFKYHPNIWARYQAGNAVKIQERIFDGYEGV